MHLSLSLLQNLVLCILWDIHQVYKNWVMRIGTNLRLALWSYLTFSFSSDACNFGKQCNVKRQIHPYNPHLFYHISVWQWGSLRHSGPQIPNSIYIYPQVSCRDFNFSDPVDWPLKSPGSYSLNGISVHQL